MENCYVGVVGTGVMATGTAALLTDNRDPTVMYGRSEDYELRNRRPFCYFSTITIEE